MGKVDEEKGREVEVVVKLAGYVLCLIVLFFDCGKVPWLRGMTYKRYGVGKRRIKLFLTGMGRSFRRRRRRRK